MRKAIITDFLFLVVVYLLLFIVNFFLLPALAYSLVLNLIISFLLGLALCYAGYSNTLRTDVGLNSVISRLFNMACLSLFLNLSLLMVSQNYMESRQPIVNAKTVSNLPNGSFLLKVESVTLNTQVIGNAYLYEREKGLSKRLKHFYAIPITTNNDRIYSNWLVIQRNQRIIKTFKSEKLNEKIEHHRSYYLEVLRNINTKNIKFYSVSDYESEANRHNIMYRSALNTRRSTGKIKIFLPHYVDIATYKRERSNIVYWTIAITIILLAIISWLKAVLNTPNKSTTDHLNQPVAV